MTQQIYSAWNSLLGFLKRRNRLIDVFILLILFSILLIKFDENIGWNIFSEIIGAFISVFLIERILQRNEEKRRKPLVISANEDVRAFYLHFADFWLQANSQLNLARPSGTILEFFSHEKFIEIWNCLNLDSFTSRGEKFSEHLDDTLKILQVKGNQILARHGNTLEPEISLCIYRLTDGVFTYLLTTVSEKRNKDIEGNIPRPPILFSYALPPSEEEIESLNALAKWCNSRKLDNSLLRLYFSDLPGSITYSISARINQEERSRMDKLFQRFLADKKS